MSRGPIRGTLVTMTATRRNALMIWLVPTLCFAAAPPLGGLLGTTAFRFAPNAAILVGAAMSGAYLLSMIAELNAAAGTRLVWWHAFIPFYNLYWFAKLVPAAMTTAKTRANKPDRRSSIAYLFVPLYAIAADLNDLAPA